MGKPRSSKSAETDFDEYVTRRISELGLATNLKDIRTAATQFENVVASVERQASGLLAFAAICFGFILYTVPAFPSFLLAKRYPSPSPERQGFYASLLGRDRRHGSTAFAGGVGRVL